MVEIGTGSRKFSIAISRLGNGMHVKVIAVARAESVEDLLTRLEIVTFIKSFLDRTKVSMWFSDITDVREVSTGTELLEEIKKALG